MPPLFGTSTSYRLARIAALVVGSLLFLYACERSRSTMLSDVWVEVLLAAAFGLAGIGAAWFEIMIDERAARSGKADTAGLRFETGERVIRGRIARSGNLVLHGRDLDSDYEWSWTFRPATFPALRAALGDEEGDLLKLMETTIPQLDRNAQADPGAWLRAHDVPATYREKGDNPAQATRELPILHIGPPARPRSGSERRHDSASTGERNRATRRRTSSSNSADERSSRTPASATAALEEPTRSRRRRRDDSRRRRSSTGAGRDSAAEREEVDVDGYRDAGETRNSRGNTGSRERRADLRDGPARRDTTRGNPDADRDSALEGGVDRGGHRGRKSDSRASGGDRRNSTARDRSAIRDDGRAGRAGGYGSRLDANSRYALGDPSDSRDHEPVTTGTRHSEQRDTRRGSRDEGDSRRADTRDGRIADPRADSVRRSRRTQAELPEYPDRPLPSRRDRSLRAEADQSARRGQAVTDRPVQVPLNRLSAREYDDLRRTRRRR
ncbi:hypothetical protein ACFVMC_31610 [Nocardia sp. NPDC127579]|uniref:hypothetical protein n=1 Tax=Nocardia sp. NPDC127579 TaxID=3345402 RepID=UPI0036281025